MPTIKSAGSTSNAINFNRKLVRPQIKGEDEIKGSHQTNDAVVFNRRHAKPVSGEVTPYQPIKKPPVTIQPVPAVPVSVGGDPSISPARKPGNGEGEAGEIEQPTGFGGEVTGTLGSDKGASAEGEPIVETFSKDVVA